VLSANEAVAASGSNAKYENDESARGSGSGGNDATDGSEFDDPAE